MRRITCRIGPILILCPLILYLGGCTEKNPAYAIGIEGHVCYSDHTCEPGLQCIGNSCEPEGAALDSGDSALSRKDWFVPDPESGSCLSSLNPPQLETYPRQTSEAIIPLRGHASGATKVMVSGGARTQTAPVVSNTFCVNLELLENTTNHLQVVSQDARGCSSLPTTALITQKQGASINLVLGKVPFFTTPPTSGNLNLLTDGKVDKPLVLSFKDADDSNTCDKFAFVWFNLGSVQTLNKVVVKYDLRGNPSAYFTCWKLLGSTQAVPGELTLTNPDWTVLKEAQDGTSGTLTITLPQTSVRHLVFFMYEDGLRNGTKSDIETFAIAEIEAWNGSDSTPAGTCP